MQLDVVKTMHIYSTPVQILHCVLQHRRLLQENESNRLLYLPSHLQKIQFFVDNNKPVHFVLPAFPAKSPNPQKVLGPLPDMGERLSLQFLQSLCNEIQGIYPPGARITICSDGRVFSDLVCVTDENVTAYSEEIKHILKDINATSLDAFGMEDIFNCTSFTAMRQKLVQEYAASVDEVRNLIKTDFNHKHLFNGIHRFLFEDYLVLQPHKTSNKVRAECKEIAYHVIQRSNAWSNLIAEQFPYAIRLSIHPQPRDAEKIGIHLIKTDNNWGTPWHNVAVHDGTEFRLMKRSKAEEMNATLAYYKGRPSHFTLANTTQKGLVM